MPANFVSEDTSFVVGDSPATLDVNSALGRNASHGYIACDGAGVILIEISHDGSAFDTQFTLNNGDTFSLENIEGGIDTIRITHSADSSYRVHAL